MSRDLDEPRRTFRIDPVAVKENVGARWLCVIRQRHIEKLLPTSGPESDYRHVNGQKDVYYGHVSYVEAKDDGEDPLVFREGRSTPEIAILNLPLGPGDVVQTSGGRRLE